MHIGSARTALLNYLFARHSGGVFVLRIEDTDVARSDARYETSILDDVEWLGLSWDEGPDRGGPCGPYRQSERLAGYAAAAEELVRTGRAYRCFCSAARLEELRAARLAQGLMPLYDRRCLGLSPQEVERRMAAGEPAAIRLRVPDGEVRVNDLILGPVTFSSDVIGDFIIRRSDGGAAYNFAAALDDRDMGITHVIRGDDHLTNTARQLMLFAALESAPPRYAHHSLILGPDGGKLSKRHGATAVGDFRELGYLPQAITNYLALLSWSHGDEEVMPLARLVAEFDLAGLASSPAVFDQAKLDWLDHQHILALDPGEHERRFAARLPAGTPPQAAKALAAAFQPSLVAYGQAEQVAAPVLERPVLDAGVQPALAPAAPWLRGFGDLRAGAPEWLTAEAARDVLAAYRRLGAEAGVKPRELLMPLRLALTGCEHGPELHYVLAALDRHEALERVAAAVALAATAQSEEGAP